MQHSKYDWPLIIHKVKIALHITDIDIAVDNDCDPSIMRYYRFQGGCPKFDLGEWLRIRYEKAYGSPMPEKRLRSW